MKFFQTVILIFNFFGLLAQSKVEMSLQLLTPDLIGNVILDKDPFIEWVKLVNEELENQLKTEKGNKEVLVLYTVHPDRNKSITVSARPEMDAAKLENIYQNLIKIKGVTTKITDYSFYAIAKVNKGCKDKEKEFVPKVIMPEEQRLIEFEKLSLVNKKKALQQFIITEVIPLIAAYETMVDPKFAGVLSIGKMIETDKFLNMDAEVLTDKNSNYWRATMEMSVGNQLIPFTKACLLLAEGDFDKAKRLLKLIGFFADDSSLPGLIKKEIFGKLDILNEELYAEINKGIALHDTKKYAAAISIYDPLLKIFPHSAWLHYEHFYSSTADLNYSEKRLEEWAKSKEKIDQCDLLYPVNFNMKTGKEAYIFFIKQELKELFQSKTTFKKDFIRYADIAFECGDYGLAAQMYWLIISSFAKEEYNNRNLLAHYLYCLDKLGDNESKKNFEMDYKKEFDLIDVQLKKNMESSSFYNSFKKKD